MIFPENNKSRQYCCFVCGIIHDDYESFKKHILEDHEEGREYVKCPVVYCGCPCRDLRPHFKQKHPTVQIPKGIQYKATVMYDVRNGKKKKIPSFKEGTFISKKNNGKIMHYRSSYELDVFECLEILGDVLCYDVEPFYIEYIHKGKIHKYYPDILVKYIDGNVELIEIKPSNQTNLEVNKSKWSYAESYCINRGWKFEVYTENRINQLKKKTK